MDVIQSHPDGVDPLIGQVLDERYRIEELLGEGGIGRVYKARHATLGKLVALKVLLTRYESIPVLKQRFQREAEALAALSHPNIVTVTDYGVSGSTAYIVMEKLEGEDLNDVLARGEVIEPRQALDIARQMLRAMAYAHEQGLVHRDLKPHNVFVRSLGGGDLHVEVLDFGLARFVTDAYKNAPKLTAQGALLGTPAYMAPEQARGEEADARADVYAAGCVIFEALTGRRVFESQNPGDILRAHMLSPPPPIQQADPGLEVDPAFQALILKSLEKNPNDRYANGGELLEALNAIGAEPVRRIAPRPAGLAPMSGVAPTQAPNMAPTAAATPQARAAQEALEAPVSLPNGRLPLFLGAGCAALVLMAIGAAGVYWYFGGQSPTEHAQSDDDAPPPPPPVPPPEPVPPSAPEAHDPFDGDVPELLQQVYERIEARGGGAVTRTQAAALTRYQADHSDDPRPHVLNGHINIDAHRWGLGLGEYETAVEQDTRVRGDPLMLPRVLLAVRQEETAAAASEFVVGTWGAEARPALAAALRERMPPEERERLEALQQRIGGAPSEDGREEDPWR